MTEQPLALTQLHSSKLVQSSLEPSTPASTGSQVGQPQS